MNELIKLNDLYAKFNKAILENDVLLSKSLGLEINKIHGECMWKTAVAYGNLHNSLNGLPLIEIKN